MYHLFDFLSVDYFIALGIGYRKWTGSNVSLSLGRHPLQLFYFKSESLVLIIKSTANEYK